VQANGQKNLVGCLSLQSIAKLWLIKPARSCRTSALTASFRDVGGCLILAAGQVEIGHALVVQDAKTVTAFVCDINAAISWTRSIEKNVLGSDELPRLNSAAEFI
jgi:hypothetical protein